MRKKYGLLAVIALICTLMLGVSSCGDGDSEQKPQLPSVDASTVKIVETETLFSVSWIGVTPAEYYTVECGSSSARCDFFAIDLRSVSGFEFPKTDEIELKIIAHAKGYGDSAPTTITYKTEGVTLRSPEIISFENGVIEWKAANGSGSYVLKVNDSFVSTGADNLYTETKYDISNCSGVTKIEIVALGDGVWLKDSAATAVVYDPERQTLSMLPISGFTVDGETLKWNSISGASAYRVVDLDFNATVVTDTYYDMSGKNIVYGVYPVSAIASVESADMLPTFINYLDGSGTESDPYLIRTPFDLRAIDYYEARFAELGGERNHYRIENDIDYNTVSALESDSNLFTLAKPFYGVLDGNNKKLSNIRVNYDGGFWALFDFIANGATVKNIQFDSPEITNKLQDSSMPLNPSIAMVANRNYGTVSGITLKQAEFTATGGEIGGIVAHNYGTVSGCSVSGTLVQNSTTAIGNASYEMAGVVLENCNGGRVDGNTVVSLVIRGSSNIRSAAGVVAINRAGGTVSNNSFESVTITGMVADSEYGGVTAYNAGVTVKGTGELGTFICDGTVTVENGTSNGGIGKLIGKNG